MKDMTMGGEIFPDDVDRVRKCLSPEFLIKYFANGHDRFTIRYKRKMDICLLYTSPSPRDRG